MQAVLSPGLVVRGRFQICELLGQGGYGSVYRALDLELDREVAIKFLEVLDRQIDLRRFQREAKYMSLLGEHPNIARVFAIDLLDADKPYIVMEFLSGRSLRSELRSNGSGLPYEQSRKIVYELCSALSYAHNKGIVHRDISPSNVFLVGSQEKPTVKLIDFGLAALMEKSQRQTLTITRTGALVGNLAYMSPETCKGLRADHLSDIYSLGCTMYELLTGKPPFCDSDFITILHKQETEYPQQPIFDWADREKAQLFDRIILKCLQKDKNRRFQSINEVVDALESESCDVSELESWSSVSKYLSSPRKSKTIWMIAVIFSIAVAIFFIFEMSVKKASTEQSFFAEFEERNEKADLRKQVQDLLGARDDFSEAGYARRSCRAFQLCRSTEDFGAIPLQTRLEACNAFAESLTLFGLPRMGLKAYDHSAKWWSAPGDSDKIRQSHSVSHVERIYSFASLGDKDSVVRELSRFKELSDAELADSLAGLLSMIYVTHSGLMEEPDSLLPNLLEVCSKKPEQLLELANALTTFGKYLAAETSLHAFEQVSGRAAAEKYEDKLQILKARLSLYQGRFPGIDRVKALLKKDFEKAKYLPAYSDLDYFASEDLAIPFSLPNAGNPKSSVSIEGLKRLLIQGRGWREIDIYARRLLAQERDPDEVCRLECLIMEINGGLDALHSPSQAFLLCSTSTPRELRLRAMYCYAKFLMARGYYSKARELFKEIEQDISKHGFPEHIDYGLKIDESVLADSRSLVLKSFIDAGDLQIADNMMLSLLKSGIRGNLAAQMLRVDLICNQGRNCKKIIEMILDPEAALDAGRFLLRHGQGELCRRCLSRGKALLGPEVDADSLSTAVMLSSFESLSYLEESQFDKARLIMKDELSKLGTTKPTKVRLKRGRESASEVVGIFLLSLQLSGMEDSIEAAKSRLEKLFQL